MYNTGSLEKIRAEATACKDCPLWEKRNNVVFGEGSSSSNIIFIGEAPGRNEDIKGVPFCGRAGEVLDALLSSVELARRDVYITNIVKCRPPNNRDPQPSETAACRRYLERQIEIINPGIICCLGSHALRHIIEAFNLGEKRTISQIHGKVIEQQVDIFKKIKIVVLYHPAVAVYNSNQMGVLKKDFSVLREI